MVVARAIVDSPSSIYAPGVALRRAAHHVPFTRKSKLQLEPGLSKKGVDDHLPREPHPLGMRYRNLRESGKELRCGVAPDQIILRLGVRKESCRSRTLSLLTPLSILSSLHLTVEPLNTNPHRGTRHEGDRQNGRNALQITTVGNSTVPPLHHCLGFESAPPIPLRDSAWLQSWPLHLRELQSTKCHSPAIFLA